MALLTSPDVLASIATRIQARQQEQQQQATTEAQSQARVAEQRAKAAEARAAEGEAKTRVLEAQLEEANKRRRCLEDENANLAMGADKTGTGFRAWILGQRGQGNGSNGGNGGNAGGASGSAGGAPGSSSAGTNTGTAGNGTAGNGTAGTGTGSGTGMGGAPGDRAAAYGNIGEMLRSFLAAHASGAPAHTSGAPANALGAPALTRPELDREKALRTAADAQMAAQGVTLQALTGTLESARDQIGELHNSLSQPLAVPTAPGAVPRNSGGPASSGGVSMSVSMANANIMAHDKAAMGMTAQRLRGVPTLRQDFGAEEADEFLRALEQGMVPARMMGQNGETVLITLDDSYVIRHFCEAEKVPKAMVDEIHRRNLIFEPDLAAFKAMVRTWAGVEVNAVRNNARRFLLDHKVRMGPEQPVSKFLTTFMQYVQKAGIEEEAMRIDLFQRGLTPELQVLCLVDEHGCDWSTMDALVACAIGKQKQLHKQRAVDRAHAQSTPGPYRHAMGHSRPPLPPLTNIVPSQAQVVAYGRPYTEAHPNTRTAPGGTTGSGPGGMGGSRAGVGPGPNSRAGAGPGPSSMRGPTRHNTEGVGAGPSSARGMGHGSGQWQGSGPTGYGGNRGHRHYGPREDPPTLNHVPSNQRNERLPEHNDNAARTWVIKHGLCMRCLTWPIFPEGEGGPQAVSIDGKHQRKADRGAPFWCANPEAPWPPNVAALERSGRPGVFEPLPQ